MKFSTDLSDAISSGFSLEDPSDKVCFSCSLCEKISVFWINYAYVWSSLK